MIASEFEEWRPIPKTDGLYSASSLGRIRSESVPGRTGRQRGRVLTPAVGRKGYLQFRVSMLDGSEYTIRVHRAVAYAFHGPSDQEVNHKDGNKLNNRPDNLEYTTCRENIRHAWANGLYKAKAGADHNGAKLDEAKVRAIRAGHPAKSYRALAGEYGVTVQNIASIVKRKTWRHVA